MKVTLPKTNSSHLRGSQKKMRKSSRPIFQLQTVRFAGSFVCGLRFRTFFSDPQHRIQVWMEGLFQHLYINYLTMTPNRKTPGAKVAALATLQSSANLTEKTGRSYHQPMMDG